MIAQENYTPYIAQKIRVGEENVSFDGMASAKRYFFFKRVFDVLFSVVVIAGVLSWLSPLIALLIRLDSKGPVFFLQKRIGKGGAVFTCYKFRTMIVNEQSDECPASVNDHRITGIGRWLRISKLDELPQFLNVLAGSMSIVGPRPYMVADCRRFSALVPAYSFRNLVKPGITGLAQVKGLHGPVADAHEAGRRYHWDALYVRNISFTLDFRILRQTAFLFITQQIPVHK